MLVLVGTAVAILAVTALHHPKGRLAANASQSESVSSSASASGSKPKSSAPRSTQPGTPTASRSTPSSSPAGSGRLPLVVLNNSSSTTATTAADRFRQGGWTVTDTSTFAGSILSTAAYYDPNVAGAQTAAEALQQQFPAIQRVKPKFGGLPGGPIVVVLTSDYS
ncbi:MAG: LytR C-terminal domain-containing protein [Jatrophihabitantaceae bacterium]